VPQPDMRKKDNKDLIAKIKKRYKFMYEADQDNRREAMLDFKFVNEPGHQWDANMKQERGERPCYEFNKLRVTGKRIINDIRANRPAGKVRAVEGGDKEIADIYEGLIRNIWNISDGDACIDYEAEYQVHAGMGSWRVDTEYSDDTAFNQDLMIRPIENPFCLYADPSCKDSMKRDAEDWILTEKISHKIFEKRYPKAEKVNFEDLAEFDDDDDWEDEQNVRIAEYWYKVPHRKELWLLEDGTVVDSESDEANAPELQEQIERRREVDTYKIMWCIVSGDRVLEGPTEWAGRQFPFVMVYGEYMVVDGRPKWWGLPRFAKDAQRSYNFARTAIAETIALAPQAKWWATTDQAAGHTDKWAVAHKKNFPFMLYTADAKAPGAPARMGGADIPVALMQETQLASEEIKAVTGIFDPSLGASSNETSGRAIYARQQQGEIATFNYKDNIANGIRRTYEILIDLIPEIYDTERELRILGSDGAEDYVSVNQVVYDPEEGRSVRVNDLQTGKYDVTVTIGPSFATQRQEAAETYGQLANQFPEMMGVAGDLVFKSMDLPYADDIAERLRTLLPPQVQQLMNQGKEIDPEVMAMMQQAEQAMQMVEEQASMVSEAEQNLGQEQARNEKAKAEIKTELANVRAAKAEFDAHMAKEVANLIKLKAELETKVLGDSDVEQALDASAMATQAAEQAQDTINVIDGLLANFMQVADEAFGNLSQKADKSITSGNIRREGGKLIADVSYDDGSQKSVAAVREKGGLRLVPESDADSDGG